MSPTSYRNHFQTATIDYATSRFVVCKATGLNVAGKHLEMGDEVPRGVLNALTLQTEYEPPLHRIELIEAAIQDPNLREACARRGVVLEASEDPKPQVVLPPLDDLDRDELILLCESLGLSTHGNQKQLRKRLETKLG